MTAPAMSTTITTPAITAPTALPFPELPESRAAAAVGDGLSGGDVDVPAWVPPAFGEALVARDGWR